MGEVVHILSSSSNEDENDDVQHEQGSSSAANSSSAKRPRPEVIELSSSDDDDQPGKDGINNKRVGKDGRIRWNGTTLEALDNFIASVMPSQVSSMVASWIQVENITHASPGYGFREDCFAMEPYVVELGMVEKQIERTNRVSAASKIQCAHAILRIAQDQRYTTGKWMIFFPPNEADAGWEKIARATAKGELGCSAKIEPAQDAAPTGVLCCVYVRDFAERSEVRRVLVALQHLGMQVRSGFKPDVYTSLNIMGGNKWRLEPTIYKVSEASEWPVDVAKAIYE